LETPVDGIIFDLDGTLVDATLNFVLIRQQVGCPQGTDLLKFIAAMEDKEMRKHASDIVLSHELEDARQSKWLPGGEHLVNRLHQLNIPQAIVTRNSAQACSIKMKNNHIPIDTVITREHYPPKPAPDALLAIANDWDISPQRLMYVGDFLYDVQAGNNAGMLSCLITHGRTLDYAADADFCFAQLDEFATALFDKST
jgi:HAD superfamily hydrolase (TIGR01509 family)